MSLLPSIEWTRPLYICMHLRSFKNTNCNTIIGNDDLDTCRQINKEKILATLLYFQNICEWSNFSKHDILYKGEGKSMECIFSELQFSVARSIVAELLMANMLIVN